MSLELNKSPREQARPSAERDRIGAYRLEGTLGRGAAGVVYRGAGPDGQPVAVKVLHPHRVDEGFKRRFEREAQVRIQHQNIVQVLDTGLDVDGTPFIAFELLDGESLDARLERGSLDPEEVVDIGLQACHGLAAAHAQGVIHRDLKPANLFCCSDGTIKLLDFGMALLTSRATRLTWGDIIVGTPAYLSPEQARGDHELDPQTDVWALGAILYEALTGRLPFDRDTVLATIVAIRMDKVTPLSVCAPRVPPALAAIVERALWKKRNHRWKSAEELSDALSRVDLTPGPSQPATGGGGILTPGENRVVAVVLADEVSEPEVFTRAVTEQGGVVMSLLSNRAIGLFGGESWEGDEVVRATRAALAARGSARYMSVASGQASLAGAALSGDVLGAAEKGCSAHADGLVVDRDTARSIRTSFELRNLTEELGLLEVIASSNLPPTTLEHGVPGAILGRETELAQLRRALETVGDEERALAILVTGPPGVGKSRLLREVEDRADEWIDDVRLQSGRAEPHQRDTALSLVRALLDEQIRAHMAESESPAGPVSQSGSRRRDALFELARDAFGGDLRLGTHADFLCELVGLPVRDTDAIRAARRDPQLMTDRLRVAVQDYFEALCERHVVVVLLEDLQWADMPSLELIEDLFDRLADLPLLIIASARPELEQQRPHLFAGGELIRIELRGLRGNDVGRLAESILSERLPDSAVRAITQHTAGNPLFVEQICSELGESRPLDSNLSSFPLPLTVQAAVQSRLDHLPSREKQLCKMSSVLQRAFFADEVEALGLADAEEVLASLCRRNIMVARGRSRVDRGRRYRFKTTLIADVAHRMLADEVRIGLHQRAAAYLATLPETDHQEVADHYQHGGDPVRAAHHYVRAAFGAAQRGDTETVLRCSERALELGVATADRFELHMARADALRFRRHWDDRGRELETALESASNDTERARALTERATWLARIGRSDDSLATADEAVKAARLAGHRETLALALGRRIAALVYAGRLTEARAAADEATQLAQTMSPHMRAMAASWIAQLATALGDLSERRLAFREAELLYTEAGDIRRAAGTDVNLADVYNRFGAYAEAEARLYAAVEGCRRVGNRLMEGYALLNLGYSLGMLGRIDEALNALDQSARLAKDMHEVRLATAVHVYRSRVLSESLNWEAALEAAIQGEQLARKAGLPGLEVAALTCTARAHLGAGRPETSLAASTRAVGLLDDLGSIEEDEAEVFLLHSHALAASGHAEQAENVRQRGRKRVEQLAERITDNRWRERFLSDVAAHRELY